MKILAIERECNDAWAEDFDRYGELEAFTVWELHQSGKIREIYFRKDQNSAVIVLECKSVGEAEKILATLPLVKNKLVKFEIIPLKAYPGFERLFKEVSNDTRHD